MLKEVTGDILLSTADANRAWDSLHTIISNGAWRCPA